MAFPVTIDATWVNPASVTLDAGELRRADSAAFAGVGSAIGVGGGIVRHGDTSLAVTVDGSDNVTIQPGAVVIPGNAVSGTGCYRSGLSAAATNALTARHATLGRIDLVVYRMLDTDVVGAHTDYRAKLDVIAGTPSATPSVPTLPSMAVELGRISVPATGGGSATVDSSFRTYAAAIGGTLPVTSSARLPASAATGQRAVALDTLVEYKFNGTSWSPVTSVPGDFRSGTASTDASGFYTYTHGLGYTPSAVFGQLGRATGALYTEILADTLGATTMRLRFLSPDGTAAASVTGVPFWLLCVR